jgi:hypothetical protein
MLTYKPVRYLPITLRYLFDEGQCGIQRVRCGRRGAPKFDISADQLKFLMSCGFNMEQMAVIMSVSSSTIKRALRLV